MYTYQRNEAITFFDGRSEIQANFIRKIGNDAKVMVTSSPVSVYPQGEVAVIPLENITINDRFENTADDASLDLHD